MKVMLILDFCGESETEFYEVQSPSAEQIIKFNGQFVNTTTCSEEMNKWFDSLYDEEGDRKPMGKDFKRLDKGPCGPFNAIVECGMIP